MRAQIAISCDVITAEAATYVMSPMSTELNTGRDFFVRELNGYTKKKMMRGMNTFSFNFFNANTA